MSTAPARLPLPRALPLPSAGAPTAGHAAPLPGVSIVLPCFDEEDNVVEAVRAARLAGRRAALAHEVIVVDDGSRDRTRERARALAAEDPDVRLIVHERNSGYGAALRSGIAAASQPWILLTDADLQFDLTQLEDFLPFTDLSDLVLGRRVLRMDPLGRRLAAGAWNRLVRVVFGLPVRDVDCAFKLVRADVVKDLPLTSSGAMISTELVIRCLARGARLRQLGVRHRPRVAGRQSGTSPRVVARAFRELALARRELGRVPRA
jgi:glycosyltransferase involved in cell wall biosynthesis